MDIAIVGYGKMGRMIQSAALAAGHRITAIVDPVGGEGVLTRIDALKDESFDVVIDFSHPSAAVENILYYAEKGYPAVIGTTGWLDRKDEILASIDTSACSIIYSGNFSIGVAIMLEASFYIASLLSKAGIYDVAIEEVHHNAKADCPSGTALMIAERVLSSFPQKKKVLVGCPEGKIEPEALQISCTRVGSCPGTHALIADSSVDTITLTHSARSREGFAVGAVKAASWIVGKKGFFSMDDFLKDFLGE